MPAPALPSVMPVVDVASCLSTWWIRFETRLILFFSETAMNCMLKLARFLCVLRFVYPRKVICDLTSFFTNHDILYLAVSSTELVWFLFIRSFLGFSSVQGQNSAFFLFFWSSWLWIQLWHHFFDRDKISIDRVGENHSAFPIIANTIITYCSIVVLGSHFADLVSSCCAVAASMLIMKWQGFLPCVGVS